MKHAQKLLLAGALVAFAVLLWKLDARAVGVMVLGVGWWFALILPVEGAVICSMPRLGLGRKWIPPGSGEGLRLGALTREKTPAIVRS